MSNQIEKAEISSSFGGEPNAGGVTLAKWYWVKNKDDKGKTYERLGCVTEIGSNYVEVTYPNTASHRIHFDDIADEMRFESDPESVIRGKVQKFEAEAKSLMDQVKVLTEQLNVVPKESSQEERIFKNALVVLSQQTDVGKYKKDLVIAKETTLPDLFRKIETAHESMARWLTAVQLPIKAMSGKMKGVLDVVKDQIFNVELYAGLTEQVVLCRDGEPAPFEEKLRIMQRRLYMDEECLLNYRHGGMEFRDISKFDEWISERENLERILPFPRCLVAMRVRRSKKERKFDGSLDSALIIMSLGRLDELTFLYIRNGENLYRLSCDLDFGPLIFPEKSKYDPSGPMMAKVSSYGGRVEKFISKNEYDVLVEDYLEKDALWKKWNKENPDEEWRKRPENAHIFMSAERAKREIEDYEPFDVSSVYFDDALKTIQKEVEQYNRIAMIVQGLFDRSPVFAPHPPVSVGNPESFARSIEFVYDGVNALTTGETPDFDEYRDRCNALIDSRSVVIGQKHYWLKIQADKENKRRRSDYRLSETERYRNLATYEPYGNPGPEYVSHMDEWNPKTRKAKFIWFRDRRTRSFGEDASPIRCSVTVPEESLFNVSAYQIGDYKRFFNDPRTRADYLKWAHLLLEAEEYHARQKAKDERFRKKMGEAK